MFRLVQWKEVFQKRHAHNQNPKSTIVIIIIIVVVMQHKQIVANPHKHHCHQSTVGKLCKNWLTVILKAPRAGISKSLFVFGNVSLLFGKVYFVCLDTVGWGTLAEC